MLEPQGHIAEPMAPPFAIPGAPPPPVGDHHLDLAARSEAVFVDEGARQGIAVLDVPVTLHHPFILRIGLLGEEGAGRFSSPRGQSESVHRVRM